jgi:hypothetical protein
MTELGEAVVGLYRTFARYPLRDTIDACPHCGFDDSVLYAAPMAQLDRDTLRHFAASALTTWGGVDDFKHFLPRILEILATEGFLYPDSEGLYGRMAHGSFGRWPADEVEAVRLFARAHWADTLSRYPSAEPAESVLCGILLLGEEIEPYLEHWERALATEPARRHLADFREANPGPLWLANPYLGEGRPQEQARILQWLGERSA